MATKLSQEDLKTKTLSELLSNSSRESKLALVLHYQNMAILLANELMQDEVKQLTNRKRYEHSEAENGLSPNYRWGSNTGSIRVSQEKVPVKVPRVYNSNTGQNISLESYNRLHTAEADEELVLNEMIYGVSTNDYKKVSNAFIDGFGLSRSAISSTFVEESSKRLEHFNGRNFDDHTFVALFIDGKYLAKQQIIIALGITEQGVKILLGLLQTTTENSLVIKDLLTNIVERGFKYDGALYCAIDGSKGIKKAVKETFGNTAVIKRCSWHKRENVLSYLSEKDALIYKHKLNEVFNEPNYEKAKSKALQLAKELEKLNVHAANSLLEGLDEVLTLQRLGLFSKFSKSFSTTNIIENINSQLAKYIRNVKYWKTSDMRLRWCASALLEIEPRLRKVDNFKNLNLLTEKMKIFIKENHI